MIQYSHKVGERRRGTIGNAECRMENAKCKVQSAKCRVQSAECKVQSAECRMQNGEFRMENCEGALYERRRGTIGGREEKRI